ncbi:MAG TPA: efflux RND transporter periplasmic adaptor subunit [Burkholderiaceae bacterium]|jgi:membrane fusion protein (multidrug efflux system)|nr:efflux RND transporter periplasmic adaptor subunit [Burkholderiaceae bacterium]
MSNPTQSTQATPLAAKSRGRIKLLGAIALAFAAIGVAYGAYYELYQRFYEETDDAYVGGNLVYVNSLVSGTVVGIGADDNQPVKAGQALIRLDHVDSVVGLADAEARLGETVRQIRQQFRAVDEAAAVLDQRKSDLARAIDDLGRRTPLAGTDSESGEDLAHARAAVVTAKDAYAVAQKQLASARVAVDGTTLRQHPSLLRARAAYLQAYLAAQRNDIPAPIDGIIARRSVQVGQRVAPGNALMAVVPLSGVWVDANVKEPQLRAIRIGQPASVSADLYGSHVEYHGKVAGIAAGTGGAFSLLPPQNATGNWIKVVQRVPVRIVLDPAEVKAHPLRVGLSTTVNIDTHNRDGSVLTALPMNDASLNTPVYDALLKTADSKADAIIAREAGHDQ